MKTLSLFILTSFFYILGISTLSAANWKVYVAKYKQDKTCAITYTFDDGLAEHSTVAAPELEKRGFRGTFWVCGFYTEQGASSKLPRMTWDELKQMAKNGHEISNHSWSHQNAKRLTLEQVKTEIEKNDSAIAYYEQALLVCNNRNKPLVYGELASLYIDKGEYLKSYKYIQKVLSSPSKRILLDPTYLTLGKLFHKTNQIDSAYFYLRLCTNSPILKTRAGAFYYLAQLELEKKHWKYYAINQIQYEELRDSINLIKQTESIRKMESLYDYHQAESKFLKAKILLDKMKIRYLYMCLFGGICLICVVMGAICVYFSLKRKKMKLCEQRERLFALKKKRDEDQIRLEHNEKMIQCLEKQLEESSMAYTEKDKELMALQKLKLEAENQTLKCVKTEKQLLIEEFCMSDIYYRFHLKEEWRPKEEDWDELFKAIDNTYDNFTHRLMGVAPRLTMTELRVSCLIKANVPPVTIAMLIVTTPTNVSMIRKRLYDKIHSEKGSSEKFDKFIRDF